MKNKLTSNILLAFAIVLIIITSVIFKSPWMALSSGVLGLITIFFQAKGCIAGQIIGVLDSLSYGIFAFTFGYYGEFIVYVIILVPIFIYGVFSWAKNSKNAHVTPKKISQQEWMLVGIFVILFGTIFYFILKFIDCKSLYLNLISMISLTLANYLIARRSFWGFVFLIINDIVLILLWGIVIIQGDIRTINFLLCAVIYLINDICGLICWIKDYKLLLSKTSTSDSTP